MQFEPRENNYLAALAERDGSAGLAFVDLSTGDFRATEFSGPEAAARLQEELERMRPSELLVASRPTSPVEARPFPSLPSPRRLSRTGSSPRNGARLLRDHFRVATLAGYGLEGHALAVAAAGAGAQRRADATERGQTETRPEPSNQT